MVVGDELLGLVLFGSCARGEQTVSSDVDLLVVVSSPVQLNRDLYRRWDETSRLDNVSPHFVHLPDGLDRAGSIWFEVAVEGIILFERDRAVTRFVQDVRRAIADGKVERRYSHGHPYWVKNTG